MDWRSSSARWKAALAVFLIAASALALWSLSRAELAYSPEAHGTLGAMLGGRDRGWWRVAAVKEGSVLAERGVKAGDAIRFDRPGDALRILEAGESVGLLVRSAGDGTRHLEVRARAEPVSRGARVEFAMIVSGTLLLLAVGGLVGWRGADSVALRALAASLLSQTLHLPSFLLPPGALQDALANYSGILTFMTAYVGLVYFALAYAGWPLLGERRGRIAFRAYFALFAIDSLVVFAQRAWPESGFQALSIRPAGTAFALFSSAFALLVLVIGWRRAAGVRRERLAWIVLCLGAIDGAYFVENFASLFQSERISFAADMAAGLMISGGNAGLGYAVLRHRVLDFGFAVNRAMVYGTTSLFLAGAFMLASQLLNRILQFEAREDHRILDVAIGLGLALTARQAVRWVDPRVQRVFFRRWHAAASKLAAFRIDAIHGKEPAALRVEFLHAVVEYAEAEGAAFYRAAGDGTLQRTEAIGAAPPAQVEAGDPLVAALEGSSGAIDVPRTGSVVPAALALSMKAHGRLVGVVLVGAKAEGEPFRPDERKQLALTAQQVGIELELARLRALESALEKPVPPPQRKRKPRAARAR